MNIKPLICLLLLTLMFQGCERDSYFPPDKYRGEAGALKNGKKWRAWVYARSEKLYPQHGFHIGMHIYNENLELREDLGIYRIPYAIQTNVIDTFLSHIDTVLSGASFGTFIDDGDVLSVLYLVDKQLGFVNYVSVTSYDPETGEISGNFQVTLVSENGPPDTVRFTDGHFHTWIEK